jgi:hypothetical protein
MKMKKILLICLVSLIAVMVAASFFSNDFTVNIDGQDIDGVAGFLVAGVAGGFGLLIGALVVLIVGAMLAFFFVGGTLLVVGALALAGVMLALVAFPLFLPVLIPVLLVWGIAKLLHRNKKAQFPALPQ